MTLGVFSTLLGSSSSGLAPSGLMLSAARARAAQPWSQWPLITTRSVRLARSRFGPGQRIVLLVGRFPGVFDGLRLGEQVGHVRRRRLDSGPFAHLEVDLREELVAVSRQTAIGLGDRLEHDLGLLDGERDRSAAKAINDARTCSYRPRSPVQRIRLVVSNSCSVIRLPPGTRSGSSTLTSPGVISKAWAPSGKIGVITSLSAAI